MPRFQRWIQAPHWLEIWGRSNLFAWGKGNWFVSGGDAVGEVSHAGEEVNAKPRVGGVTWFDSPILGLVVYG
jgi:hypothetical protein